MDVNRHVRDALLQMRLGTRVLDLNSKDVGDAGAATLAAELRVNATLETLILDNNGIGPTGAQSLASALTANVALKMLSLDYNSISSRGACAFAEAFRENAAQDKSSLTLLSLGTNNIDDIGVLELAGVLNSTALSVLNLSFNNISAVSAQALATALLTNVRLSRLRVELDSTRLDVNARNVFVLASALDTNRTLQSLVFNDNGVTVDIKNRVADRLRVNKLVLKLPAWVALAVARLNEVPGHLRWPPSFAARAAALAFGDELLEQVLPCGSNRWRTTPEGREFAVAYLLPLAEASLLQYQQQLLHEPEHAQRERDAAVA